MEKFFTFNQMKINPSYVECHCQFYYNVEQHSLQDLIETNPEKCYQFQVILDQTKIN